MIAVRISKTAEMFEYALGVVPSALVHDRLAPATGQSAVSLFQVAPELLETILVALPLSAVT